MWPQAQVRSTGFRTLVRIACRSWRSMGIGQDRWWHAQVAGTVCNCHGLATLGCGIGVAHGVGCGPHSWVFGLTDNSFARVAVRRWTRPQSAPGQWMGGRFLWWSPRHRLRNGRNKRRNTSLFRSAVQEGARRSLVRRWCLWHSHRTVGGLQVPCQPCRFPHRSRPAQWPRRHLLNLWRTQ